MQDLRTRTIHEKSGQSGDFALENFLAFEVDSDASLKALLEHVMTFFQPEIKSLQAWLTKSMHILGSLKLLVMAFLLKKKFQLES